MHWSTSTEKWYYFSGADNESRFTVGEIEVYVDKLNAKKLEEELARQKTSEQLKMAKGQVAKQKLLDEQKALQDQLVKQQSWAEEQLSKQQRWAEEQLSKQQRWAQEHIAAQQRARPEAKQPFITDGSDGGQTKHVFDVADLTASTMDMRVILHADDDELRGSILVDGTVVTIKLNKEGKMVPSEARKYKLMRQSPGAGALKRKWDKEEWDKQEWGSSSWGSSSWEQKGWRSSSPSRR